MAGFRLPPNGAAWSRRHRSCRIRRAGLAVSGGIANIFPACISAVHRAIRVPHPSGRVPRHRSRHSQHGRRDERGGSRSAISRAVQPITESVRGIVSRRSRSIGDTPSADGGPASFEIPDPLLWAWPACRLRCGSLRAFLFCWPSMAIRAHKAH